VLIKQMLTARGVWGRGERVEWEGPKKRHCSDEPICLGFFVSACFRRRSIIIASQKTNDFLETMISSIQTCCVAERPEEMLISYDRICRNESLLCYANRRPIYINCCQRWRSASTRNIMSLPALLRAGWCVSRFPESEREQDPVLAERV